MARTSRTRYAILGLLSMGPMSGYDIKRLVDTRLRFFWRESFGQIYPILSSLVDEGAVSKIESAVVGRGPRRNVYALTDAGRAELRAWLEMPFEEDVPRYEILLKLFFGAEAPVEVSLRHVESFREAQRMQLALVKHAASELRTILNESPDHVYQLMTALFGIYYYEAVLKWSDEAMAILEGLREGGYSEETEGP